MKIRFATEATPRRGARYLRVGIFVDERRVGYIEGLEETYLIHMRSGGEVGPYASIDAAKTAVRRGLARPSVSESL